MTTAQTHPVLATEVSKYPNYWNARTYLVNFLRHGRKAIIRTKRYAYYQHSLTLQVIVIRVAPDIYEVRAFPVDGYVVATIEQALAAEEFRAWLFAYDHRYRSTHYITGSQRESIELYKLIRLAIRHKGTLSKASRSYLFLRSHHPLIAAPTRQPKIKTRKKNTIAPQ